MTRYTLRGIPEDLWARVKARAQRDQIPIKAILLAALHRYADDAHAAGGRKAAAAMSAADRRARAQAAAAARWRKG